MKLARVLLSSLVATLPNVGCSDPPAAPHEGAAYIVVSPAGGTCSGSHGQLGFPQTSLVYDALNCDLNSGCDPTRAIVVDGDTNSDVFCTINESDTGFNVRANIRAGGQQIGFSGALPKLGGGKLQLSHAYRDPASGASFNIQGECELTIIPQRGELAPGRIWAHFTCPEVTDPGLAGGMQCKAEGAFLFQKCDGG